MKHSTLISIIRWAARITGTLMVIFVLIFAIGNFIEGLINLNLITTPIPL